MHIYSVTWYNEDFYGPLNYTDITFKSETELNRQERIDLALQLLQHKLMENNIEVDVGEYQKVKAVEIKDQVIHVTPHGGIFG